MTFTWADGNSVADAIAKTTATGEGQTVKLQSIGKNEAGDVVSEMVFEWTLKRR